MRTPSTIGGDPLASPLRPVAASGAGVGWLAVVQPRRIRRSQPERRPAGICRQALVRLVPAAVPLFGAVALLVAAPAARAQGNYLQPAAPGLVETGTPPFVILRPDGMGLSAPATDLHELPNGAMLAVNETEIAIGDGVRWETFRRARDSEHTTLNQVAVAGDGTLYAGLGGGIARVELSPEGEWRFGAAVALPRDTPAQDRLLGRVVALGGEWYWHNGSGPLVAWHPGTAPRFLGVVNDLECLFSAGGSVFASDASSGALYRIVEGKLVPVEPGTATSLDRAVTSAAPLPEGRALLGANGLGLVRFDGRTMMPLVQGGQLGGRHRINDLCAVGDGLFAAALDTFGIAFFNQEGRLLQAIDRTTSLPLARIKRLVPGRGGNVWALLNDGVACVAFPARVSDLQSYVFTGLTYSRTYRHEGRLWVAADGRVQRGIYDEDGRLIRFEPDSPEGFVTSVSTGLGPLVASNSTGIHQRDSAGWRLVLPGPANAHICDLPARDGRRLYTANDEVGWIWSEAGKLRIERFPVPGLGETFVGVSRGENAYWVELGAGRVARIAVRDNRPVVRVLEPKDGLPGTWVQVFVIDNNVRFNVAGQFLRYDEATDRVVPDTETWIGRGGISPGYGRPIRDAIGRVWYVVDNTVRVVQPESDQPRRSLERLPTSISPLFFTPEADGVVWLHERQQLLRFDPKLSDAPPAPLRAVFSHVQRMGSNTHVLFPSAELEPLEFRDNSLAVHFLAPGAVFGGPVTFETKLEGSGEVWLPAGTVGVAYFNGLKEGRYVLRARPRSGAVIGLEAMLAFTIRPPWHRTTIARVLYVSAGLGVFGLLFGGWMALNRREKRRLELLVRKRTAELQRSEERFRSLSKEVEGRNGGRAADPAKPGAAPADTPPGPPPAG